MIALKSRQLACCEDHVADHLRPFGDATENLVYQIPVRVEHCEPFSLLHVLQDEVQEQHRLPGARCSNHVGVLASLLAAQGHRRRNPRVTVLAKQELMVFGDGRCRLGLLGLASQPLRADRGRRQVDQGAKLVAVYERPVPTASAPEKIFGVLSAVVTDVVEGDEFVTRRGGALLQGSSQGPGDGPSPVAVRALGGNPNESGEERPGHLVAGQVRHLRGVGEEGSPFPVAHGPENALGPRVWAPLG